jgi:putative membrane protein
MKTLLLSGFTALALFAAPLHAQETDNGKAAIEAASKVTSAKDFLAMAAMSDRFEIDTGQMVQERSLNNEVKQFGQQLVQDHGNSTKQLSDVAGKAGLALDPPQRLDQRHQTIADSLRDAQGSGFDKAFLTSQVQAHQEGVALFEAYAKNGDNDQLKSFAQKGLPILQKHLEMAQQLEKKVPAQ